MDHNAGRRLLSPNGTPDTDEAVYEVDDVAVAEDGTVLPGAGRQEPGLQPTREPRRAGARTGYRPQAASATGDLSQARDQARRAARTGRTAGTRATARAGERSGEGARRSSSARTSGSRAAGDRRAAQAPRLFAGSGPSGAGAPADGGSRGASDAGAGRRSSRRAARSERAGFSPAAAWAAAKEKGAGAWSRARAQASSLSAGDARSQRRSGEAPDGSRTGAAGWAGRVSRPVLLVCIAVVVTCVFLYGPVRDLYHAERDRGLLLAQQEALAASNDEMLARVQALSTEDGIKDEARLHGYVEEGEQAVDVSGLPGQKDESEAAPIPDDVRRQVLEQEDPWYVRLADGLFGYQKGSETSRAS